MMKSWIPEIAQEQYYRAASAIADIPICEEDGLSWIMGQRPGYPRGIFRTTLTTSSLDTRVPEIAERMRAGELPDKWAETPPTQPPGLEQYLLGHGFKISWIATGMTLDTKRLSPQPPVHAGYTVQPLNDGSLIPEWSRTVTEELFHGDADMAEGFAEFIGAIWRDERFRLFAAMQGERLLGTSMLYMAEDPAFVGYVAVSSEARRLGIGSQLTWQAAAFARDHGFTTVALHASELGEPVYTKLGFTAVSRFHRLQLAE